MLKSFKRIDATRCYLCAPSTSNSHPHTAITECANNNSRTVNNLSQYHWIRHTLKQNWSRKCRGSSAFILIILFNVFVHSICSLLSESSLDPTAMHRNGCVCVSVSVCVWGRNISDFIDCISILAAIWAPGVNCVQNPQIPRKRPPAEFS